MAERMDRPTCQPCDTPSAEAPVPALRAFWEKLQRAKAQTAAPSPSAPSFAGGSSSGHAVGSNHGSGSGGGGYGIGLIAADEEARQRIRRIMRDLCAKDAGRK